MRLVYLDSGPSAGVYSWIHGYSLKLVRAQGLSILEFSSSLRIFFTSSVSPRRPYSYSLHPLHWGHPGCVPGSLLDTFRGMREYIGPFYAHRAKEGWDIYLGSLSTQSCKATTATPLLGNPLLDSFRKIVVCGITLVSQDFFFSTFPPNLSKFSNFLLSPTQTSWILAASVFHLSDLLLLFALNSPFLAEGLLFLFLVKWGFPQF